MKKMIFIIAVFFVLCSVNCRPPERIDKAELVVSVGQPREVMIDNRIYFCQKFRLPDDSLVELNFCELMTEEKRLQMAGILYQDHYWQHVERRP